MLSLQLCCIEKSCKQVVWAFFYAAKLQRQHNLISPKEGKQVPFTHFYLKGIPNSLSKARPSESVLDVVTIEISIPRI